METNYSEMTHAHLMQDRIKPEMNVTPSALWIKRKVGLFVDYLSFHSLSSLRFLLSTRIFKLQAQRFGDNSFLIM